MQRGMWEQDYRGRWELPRRFYLESNKRPSCSPVSWGGWGLGWPCPHGHGQLGTGWPAAATGLAGPVSPQPLQPGPGGRGRSHQELCPHVLSGVHSRRKLQYLSLKLEYYGLCSTLLP